ncbi:MAG: BamA/TamA family outer membrane protein [Cytophagales bacterium]|nr:BamA/TamA family outer membrane protein [Cytophagales bacterium]MDW8383148.1 POTRA domain-containing protein [Flammeovirgaceae bacterium]
MLKYILKLLSFFLLFNFLPLFAQNRAGLYSSFKPYREFDYSFPQEYIIAGVEVEGTEYLDKNSMIAIAGFEKGKKITIPSDEFPNAIKRLYRQGILSDIQIFIKEIRGNEVILLLRLKERPRLSKFNFYGVKKGQIEEVSEKTKLVRGRILTDAMMKNAKKAIEAYFIDKGFYNVEVRMVQEKDTLADNSVILNIFVNKKNRVRIQDILFERVDADTLQVGQQKVLKRQEERKRSTITIIEHREVVGYDEAQNKYYKRRFKIENTFPRVATPNAKGKLLFSMSWQESQKLIQEAPVLFKELEQKVQQGHRIRVSASRVIYVPEIITSMQISPRKLRKKMKKTKESRRFLASSKLIQKDYEEDKQKIIEYYNEQGYRNAKIVSDSVFRVVHKGKERISILLRIEEGRKFYYRNISWKGNYLYTDEGLSRILGIQKGDIYNPTELSKRLHYNPNGTDISSLYMDDGYLFFSVEPVETQVVGDSIDIELRIYEGEQATINKVTVNGNTKTNDHVIYRELFIRPGDKFSRSNLIRSQRELATIGFFDPEKIQIVPKPNPVNSTVDMEITVEEKASDQIELSGGYSGFIGFIGTLGVTFNNFSVRNIPNGKKWRPLPSGDAQRISIRAQTNGRFFQNYSFSFMEPWLGGRKPNSFSLSMSRSIQRIGGGFQTFGFRGGTGSLKLSNISVGVGKRLEFPDDYFTTRSSLNYTIYELNNYSISPGYNTGISHNFNYNLTIARNNLDNPTYPRNGSSLSLSATFTPPYSLLEPKRDYKLLSREEAYRNIEYFKFMLDNSWFLRIVDKLVLNTRMHWGYLGAYNNNKGVGPFERFVLGGNGMFFGGFLLGTDIIGLRGYSDNSFQFRSFDPVVNATVSYGGTAFQKYVTELRYPLSLNPSATIFVHTFFEMGNNWERTSDFNPFKNYRSVGVGARIFMPAFGMLGIDYGYGLDDAFGNKARTGQFHFIIGQPLR